jgi:hypothetical protein
MAGGDFNLNTDRIDVVLLDNGYTYVQAHDAYADVSADEVANGNGYLTGGKTISGQTLTDDTGNDYVEFHGTVAPWTASTITARYAAFFKYNADPALAYLIAIYDFGADKSSDGGSFTITENAEGLFHL